MRSQLGRCPSRDVCNYKMYIGELPGGPVVRTLQFHCHGLGSIPGQETKIPQDSQYRQKKDENKIKYKNTHRNDIFYILG